MDYDYDTQAESNIVVPGDEDYASFDDLGLTDDAIRIVHDFVMTNQHLRLTAEELAAAMLDCNGNESPDSLDIAQMVLEVWRQRNPDLEAYDEGQPSEGGEEYRDEYLGSVGDEGTMQAVDGPSSVPSSTREGPPSVASYGEGPSSVPSETRQGPSSVPSSTREGPSSVPSERWQGPSSVPSYEAYVPASLETYETRDAPTIHNHPGIIHASPDPYDSGSITYGSSASVEHRLPSSSAAYVVHQPGLEIIREEYIPPAPVRQTAEYEPWRPLEPIRPGRPTTLPASINCPDLIGNYQSPLKPKQQVMSIRSGPKPKELAIVVPPDDDYKTLPQGSVLMDAIRMVRDYVVCNSSLGISADEIAQLISGPQHSDTTLLVERVLDVWRMRNPEIPLTSVTKYSYKTPVEEAPPEMRPAYVSHVPATINLPGGLVLNVPAESDYPSFDRSGLTDDAIRIVHEFATNTLSLGLSKELLAAEMVDFLGQKRADSSRIADMVLEVWNLKNPNFPKVPANIIFSPEKEPPIIAPGMLINPASPVRPATAEVIQMAGVIEGTPVKLEYPVLAVFQGVPELNEPPRRAYGSIDPWGLTESAIKIIKEYVANTGSLGISQELLAAEMVDNKGQKRAESLKVAGDVLAIWRASNPGFPIAPVNTLLRREPGEAPAVALSPKVKAAVGTVAVYEAKKVEGQRVSTLVPASTTAVQAAYSGERPKASGEICRVDNDEYVIVEREDAGLDMYNEDLMYLLQPLGCTVEQTLHPSAGQVVTFGAISQGSVLYKSGVRPGDILYSMDNQTITKPAQLYTLLKRCVPGSCFMWKLRRAGLKGTEQEWSVVQNVPVRQVRAKRPKFAGLPPSRMYRSYTNLLPDDPEFLEHYSRIPSRYGCAMQPCTKFWDTRVLEYNTAPLLIEGCPNQTCVSPAPHVRLVETAPAPCQCCAPSQPYAPHRVEYINPSCQSFEQVAGTMLRKYDAAQSRVVRGQYGAPPSVIVSSGPHPGRLGGCSSCR